MRQVVAALVLGGALLLAPFQAASGAHLYDLDGSLFELDVNDTLVAVQFDRDLNLDEVTALTRTHTDLASDVAPEFLGARFWAFRVSPTLEMVDDSVLASLRNISGVTMVNPVFTGVNGPRYMTDEILVLFSPDATQAEIEVLLDRYSSAVLSASQRQPRRQLIRIAGQAGQSTLDVANAFYESGLCVYAQPNFAAKALLLDFVGPPPDPLFPEQWHFHNTAFNPGAQGRDIDALLAWRLSEGDTSVTVAIIDSGFDWGHDDWDGQTTPIYGYDVIGTDWRNPEEDPWPLPDCDHLSPYRDSIQCWHGTSVLGELAAASYNSIGLCGLAPRCRYYCVKAFDRDGVPTTERLARALEVAWQPPSNAKIVSCSWGWPYGPAIEHELSDMKSAGVAVFFASGNSGYVDYPATSGNVYAVGATDPYDNVWSYSGKGPALDITAPAGNIGLLPPGLWTWDVDGSAGISHLDHECDTTWDYNCWMGGTSAATPLVAGTAALVLSRRPDFIETGLPNYIVWNVLMNSTEERGDPGYDTLYGWGRLNAFRALLAVCRGDVNTDGVYNVLDIARVSWEVNNGGPPPDLHPGLSDVYCDGVKNILDLARLVDYVFRGGPMPDPCYIYDY